MCLKSYKQAWLERENKYKNKLQLSETCSFIHTFQIFWWVAYIICVTIHKKRYVLELSQKGLVEKWKQIRKQNPAVITRNE